MNFVELETYLMLAETRSFSKSAKNLFISQSTVTHRLQKLEDELGYPLFSRQQGKRSIDLTERGEEFVVIAERWISLYHEMEQLKHNDTSRLTIASVDSVITTILPKILPSLHASNDSIHLKMETHYSPGIYKMVKDHDADIGFVTTDMHDPEVRIREVFRQNYVVVRPCEHPLPDQKIHPKDLDPSHEIFTSWGSEFDKWHNKWWPAAVPFMNVDTIATVKEYLSDPSYFSIVHRSGCELLQKYLSLQVYDILDGPGDWICYEIRHRYPRQKQLDSMNTFDAALEEVLAPCAFF